MAKRSISRERTKTTPPIAVPLSVLAPTRLLSKWHEFETTNDRQMIVSCQRLMQEFSRDLSLPYDAIGSAGLSLSESQIRDSVVHLISPEAKHKLASEFLAIVVGLAGYTELAQEIRGGLAYRVRAEAVYSETRPDIEIIGENFLVFIEIKKRFGIETDIGGVPQTQRQWSELERAKVARPVGIFLTPAGMPASDARFKSVSLKVFADSAWDLLVNAGRGMIAERYRSTAALLMILEAE